MEQFHVSPQIVLGGYSYRQFARAENALIWRKVEVLYRNVRLQIVDRGADIATLAAIDRIRCLSRLFQAEQ
jgi:hypothetical protein